MEGSQKPLEEEQYENTKGWCQKPLILEEFTYNM